MTKNNHKSRLKQTETPVPADTSQVDADKLRQGLWTLFWVEISRLCRF